MVNFERVFNATATDSSYSRGKRGPKTVSTFVISTNDDWLTIRKESGRDMYMSEIKTALGLFIQAYRKEIMAEIAHVERDGRYRIVYSTGAHGESNVFIEIDSGNGYPSRRKIYHVSSLGKCGFISCPIYDLADLCVAEGIFEIKDGCYTYSDDTKNIIMIEPRITECEEGWVDPQDIPTSAVPLRVYRNNAT